MNDNAPIRLIPSGQQNKESDHYVEKTSEFLVKTLKDHPEPYLSIGTLLELLKRRSYGALLIMLSLAGLIPGISFFAGFAIFLLGLQLALGFQAPRLPRIIQKRKLHRQKTIRFIEELLPWFERIEHYIKPRWEPLSNKTARRVIGIIICVLAPVAVLPLPFVNFPPNIAIIFFALGIIERDGLFLIVGGAISLFAVWIGYILVRIAMNSLMLVL
ncbi:exopolysaccharide biosynthesis protein [Vibrio fluvialis]|uniref:exopolysaccharide biosynthesis protein n=1 Tax=Vibrio fluvialis TaxID=676 RepID=UPI001F3A24BF|nr:exopolysaccharide biosynthesis protein [Vibrio fluvialis]MCE7580321.1 exopolysaccharide biosynthesis protein [Vibrio fluvialis]